MNIIKKAYKIETGGTPDETPDETPEPKRKSKKTRNMEPLIFEDPKIDPEKGIFDYVRLPAPPVGSTIESLFPGMVKCREKTMCRKPHCYYAYFQPWFECATPSGFQIVVKPVVCSSQVCMVGVDDNSN